MADTLLDDDDAYLYDEDKMGMRVTSGTIKIRKDEGNLIGISIGGGAPHCPCLYVVQVFDKTPAAIDGTLEAGDEILSVNGTTCKGATKTEVAKLIQSIKHEVTIGYNKLHAEPKQGKTLDIVLKKLKHKIVENMSTTTADAFGLSRAILCNDSLVKKLQELDRNEYIFKGLVSHMSFLIKANIEMVQTYKEFGDVFAEIGAHEPQTEASKAFTKFGDTHRQFEKEGLALIGELKPILGDLNTYLNKAIPDTRLTIKKYADQKFEYLSYCLKVKEMDDEEYTYNALQEPLYRVETGNYEYRLILRCRQEARKRFAALRSDVLIKLELLDQKHVNHIGVTITRFIAALARFKTQCYSCLQENTLFPIELDLSKTSCLLQSNNDTDTSLDTCDTNGGGGGGGTIDEDDDDEDDDGVELELPPEMAREALMMTDELLTLDNGGDGNSGGCGNTSATHTTASTATSTTTTTTTATTSGINGDLEQNLFDVFNKVLEIGHQQPQQAPSRPLPPPPPPPSQSQPQPSQSLVLGTFAQIARPQPSSSSSSQLSTTMDSIGSKINATPTTTITKTPITNTTTETASSSTTISPTSSTPLLLDF